jgi:hypothetical protein
VVWPALGNGVQGEEGGRYRRGRPTSSRLVEFSSQSFDRDQLQPGNTPHDTMAMDHPSSAFKDKFTAPYGSSYFVSVDPIFVDQVRLFSPSRRATPRSPRPLGQRGGHPDC